MILPRRTSSTQAFFSELWHKSYNKLKENEKPDVQLLDMKATQQMFDWIIFNQSNAGTYKNKRCQVCAEECDRVSTFTVTRKSIKVGIRLHAECSSHFTHALWGWCAAHARHDDTVNEVKKELCQESVSE